MELRSNKLEKMLEKCESLEVKMGGMGGTVSLWVEGGGIVPWVGVQRKEGKRGVKGEGGRDGKKLVGGGGVPREDALGWQVLESVVR